MKDSYFSIKRDNQTIKQGGFWCEACLTSKPMDDQSPDPRYCLSCYDFLKQEAKLMSGKPKWRPVVRLQARLFTANSGDKIVDPTCNSLTKQKGLLVHSKPENTHAYQKSARRAVMGRPRKNMPTDLIKQLSKREMSIARITRELKDKGYSISAMSVQRVLSGQR